VAVVSLDPPAGARDGSDGRDGKAGGDGSGGKSDDAGVLVADADAPNRAWLEAFLAGSRAAEGARARGSTAGPADVVWAPLPSSGLALVLGRQGMAYRARERHQVAALARVVDTRMRELTKARSRARHPSR
jgi:hypothetical protein